MPDQNPYQPTVPPESEVTSNGAGARIKHVLWWVTYLHPAICVAGIYFCWTLTTVSLGRPPQFGEHPENDLAHRIIHLVDLPSMLLIIASPILIPAALGLSLSRPFARNESEATTRIRVVCLSLYALILAMACGIWHYDPFRAVYWFID